jgi:tripartite-type tricarboxylate transporter receptor subunit TctC
MVIATTGFIAAWPRTSRASAYPSRTVKLLVGAPPGGPADFTARLFGKAAGVALGQSFVVENKAGVSGALAAEVVARSDANGYALLVAGPASVVVAPCIFPQVNYKAYSFDPVAMLGAGAFVLAVHPSLPANTLHELIGLIRSRQGMVSFGSAGHGSSGHLCGELFAQRAGGRMLHVPYKGDGLAVNDLVGGQIQLMFTAPNVVVPHIKTGKLRVLAVTARDRVAALPDTPTVHEAGIEGFEYLGWIMAFAPIGTPRSVVDLLAATWNKARVQGPVKTRLDELGMAAPEHFSTSESLAAFLSAEHSRLGKVIRDAKIKAG